MGIFYVWMQSYVFPFVLQALKKVFEVYFK